ncbi:RNA-binding protein CP33, chloroplastic-like, partial [Asparagus officinalis]|uniref:RNA-binding protein CP33, chloroplastic-like n=1 Tax=Asparagus officinalis TaxID=4686 RepID=UPI00098E46B8
HVSHFALNHLSNPRPSLCLTRKGFHRLRPCSAVQDIAVEGGNKINETLEEGAAENRRKVYAVNLPWSLSGPDIEKLFGECGAVNDVEIIKQRNGKSRGFAFITMASHEEAQAVVDKFDSFELSGRIIRVEFAKSFTKPSPPSPPPTSSPKSEGRYKIYASNLAWKVRANNLRDFFSDKFKPISARVVFETPSGRSAGYGFVGFATMEEAKAAVSEMDGKELMGRPLRLKISERSGDESGEEPEDIKHTEKQSQET